ncbi:hypothetical protein [Rhodoferax antarcticus]|uniref:hypothetical protein n=1 Tax=Rhodoferax antarcticus TaxID=81479 RepID=UPI000AA7A206|nr:hypothetical protein [Rhodoferax antarcticus]
MDVAVAKILEDALTFNNCDHPDWRGDVGKCWVDCENEIVTIVGWLSDQGSDVNNYRLVLQYKQRQVKNELIVWLDLSGFDDSGNPIEKKVLGVSIDDAIDVMIQLTEKGTDAVRTLAAAVESLSSLGRSRDPYSGVNDDFPTPRKRTPLVSQQATA